MESERKYIEMIYEEISRGLELNSDKRRVQRMRKFLADPDNPATWMGNWDLGCPEVGGFIGWKKVLTITDGDIRWYVLKILIPEDAERTSDPYGRHRASKVKTLSIEHCDGTPSGLTKVLHQGFYAPCEYEIGKYTYPDSYSPSRLDKCMHGIHFVLNRAQAVGMYEEGF